MFIEIDNGIINSDYIVRVEEKPTWKNPNGSIEYQTYIIDSLGTKHHYRGTLNDFKKEISE